MTHPQSSAAALAADPTLARVRVGFALLLAMLLTMAASKAVLYDTLDPDCFWHLRVAEQLQRDGIRPIIDGLSFNSIKQPWTPYSWLAELGMKAVWDFGGYRAAIAAQSAVVALIFFVVALTAINITRAPRPYLGIAVAVVFAGYLALPYLSFRPVTLAIAIVAACAWLLVRDRHLGETSSEIWIVPLLTAVCINVHVFAIFVPFWIAALMIGAMRERSQISHWSERAEQTRRVRRYLKLLVCSFAACLATPMLPGLISSLAHYSAQDPMVAAAPIAELQPFYRGPMWPVTTAVLVLTVTLLYRNRREIRLGEWIVFLLGTVGIIWMGRLTPLFVLIAAPLLAAALPMLQGRVLSRPFVWLTLGMLLTLGVTQIVSQFPSSQTTLAQWLNRNGPEAPGYPTAAAEFVAQRVRPVGGRIINDFSWGGYLAWQLGPRFQVFMDARTQLYSPQFWHDTCLGNESSMKAAISTARADAAIVPVRSNRLEGALRSLGWRTVYRDDRAEVLVPPTSTLADVKD